MVVVRRQAVVDHEAETKRDHGIEAHLCQGREENQRQRSSVVAEYFTHEFEEMRRKESAVLRAIRPRFQPRQSKAAKAADLLCQYNRTIQPRWSPRSPLPVENHRG